MGTVIAVASGKGGTGKTSLTGGISSCLAAMGHRVLCIDADVGLRNLDIALGLSDRVMMDFSDVLEHRCTFEEALIQHPNIEGLFLLAAPQRLALKWDILENDLPTFIREIKEQFDEIFIDCPAGLGVGFRTAAQYADRAIVVSTMDPSSLRDAQQAISVLGELDISLRHLVVNRVQPKLLRLMKTNLDDAMDMVGLPLLGVVPEDKQVILAAGCGEPLALSGKGRAIVACLHIAQRLTGMRVPLMRIR